MFSYDSRVMPVHQINVDPPDWQPPQSLGPSNNTSPAGAEPLPEWSPRVRIIFNFLLIPFLYAFIFHVAKEHMCSFDEINVNHDFFFLLS